MRTLFEATFADNIKAYEDAETKLSSKLSIFRELQSQLYKLEEQLLNELNSYKTPDNIKDFKVKFQFGDTTSRNKVWLTASQVYKGVTTSHELYHMFHFILKLPDFEYGALDWNGHIQADWNCDAAIKALKNDKVKMPFVSDAKKFINGFAKFAKKLPIVQEYIDAFDSFMTISGKNTHVIESIKSSILARLNEYGIYLSNTGRLMYKSTGMFIYELGGNFYIGTSSVGSSKKTQRDVALELATKYPKVFKAIKEHGTIVPKLLIIADFIEDI